MVVPLGHKRALRAGVGTALAVLSVLAVAMPSAASAATAAATAPAPLSATPLGVNVAPWDYAYAGSTGSEAAIQSLLKAASISQLRYGGGTSADSYDWQTSTTIQGCLPYDTTASFTASCASSEPLDFTQFSKQARALGASSFVTVNYGSGTPAEAAALVSQAAKNSAQSVALWEVGNEGYGCWEVNNELADDPERFQNFVPGIHDDTGQNPTCPTVAEGIAAGMQTMATSYAVNAKQFMIAMKAADPKAAIGVPWAFGSNVQGASVGGGTEWNNTVLATDGKYVSFVDAHYYPFGFSGSTGGSNPTDQQVLRSLFLVPTLYGQIRAKLNAYDPTASVVLGETGLSNHPTMTTCTPVGALFAAGDVLSWLAAGARSVDWWDLDSYGNTGSQCVNPDEGMFTASATPAAQTPYYGYLLASLLAQPHALLRTLSTSDPSDVLAYQADLPGDTRAVALINTNTSAAKTVTFQRQLSGTLRTWRYSAGNQNAANSKIVKGTASALSFARGITLPAESITILKTR
jgi:hypothetical protein